MSNARRAALAALKKCRRSGAWSDAVLGSVMDSHRLDARDRALAGALCFCVQQNMLYLDHCVAAYSSVRLSKIEPQVLDILRLGACQILFFDKIPDSAAVSESVELCRECGASRASGLVNAVLRRVAENKSALPEIRAAGAQRLSIRYSFPTGLTEYLLKTLGDECEPFLKACNAAVPITAQVNTLRTTSEALLRLLRGGGVAARPHAYLPDCVTFPPSGAVTALPGFKDGLFYIQDPAAKLAVMAAAPKSGDRILDVCAAPGGKSFAAALLADGGAEITACDIHESRLRRMVTAAERLGVKLGTRRADARIYIPEFDGRFDVVMADVPCSGLGVIRKKPDIRYKPLSDFDALPAVQLDILKNASRCVRRGGTLLYSTCTVRPEENGQVLDRFLAGNEGFAAEGFTLCGDIASSGGQITLYPHIHGTDGFFIAKLRRK